MKCSLRRCADWSQIDKTQYMDAMAKSVSDSYAIKNLIKSALTDRFGLLCPPFSQPLYKAGLELNIIEE